MAVKSDIDWDNATVTVLTLDGELYKNCDITDQPMGESGEIISFWSDADTIKVIPMSRVEYIDFQFGVAEAVEDKDGGEPAVEAVQ